MDRRAFLKAMGAAFAVTSFDAGASPQVASPANALTGKQQATEYELADAPLPRIRLIAVGVGSQKLQDSNTLLAGWPKEDLLYVDSKEHLRLSLRDEFDTFAKEAGWHECLTGLPMLDFKRAQFRAVEKEVANFIGAADWLFILVTLDNATAFAICTEIAAIAKHAGVLTVAYVGAPYSKYGHPCADTVSSYSLKKYSVAAIDRMRVACDFVLPDSGGWSNGSWYTDCQENVFNIIYRAGKSSEQASQMRAILTAAGMGYFGVSPCSSVHEALQLTFDSFMCDSNNEDNLLVTSNGAIVTVTCHPDVAERVKSDVALALLQHGGILHSNWPLWRDEPKFMFVTEPDEYCSPLRKNYYLNVILTGLEKVQSSAAATDAFNRWRQS